MYSAAILAAALMLQPAADSAAVVTESIFLSVMQTPGGEVVRESTRIPYRPGDSCFGWGLRVEPQDRERTFEEVLRLPAPATNFGGDDGTQVEVSPDRTTATVRHNLAAGQTEIESSWCIAPGDPLGAYHIIVYDGSRPIHRFDFDVVQDEAVPVT